MAHNRKRYLNDNLNAALKISPLVGVLGHRQVGKTTLLESVADKYFVLDIESEMKRVQEDAFLYIKERAGGVVAFDECQKTESLFPAFKEWVRTHKKPGQFILSGSVRFTSREATRESLTGRILNLELLPFTISELLQLPLSDFCIRVAKGGDDFTWLESVVSRADHLNKKKEINRYIESGGLPGVCFLRKDVLKNAKIADYLLTILDRDIRLISKIKTSYSDILRLLTLLANAQGSSIDWKSLVDRSSLSFQTIKKLVSAFESVFLIRTIAIEDGRKQKTGTTFYFEDMAECKYLQNSNVERYQQLLHLLFIHVRAQWNYRLGSRFEYFQYKTRGGALIPLCTRTQDGVLGFDIVEDSSEVEQRWGSINSFLGTYSNGKIIVACENIKIPKVLKSRVLLVPLEVLL